MKMPRPANAEEIETQFREELGALFKENGFVWRDDSTPDVTYGVAFVAESLDPLMIKRQAKQMYDNMAETFRIRHPERLIESVRFDPKIQFDDRFVCWVLNVTGGPKFKDVT